MYQSVFLIAEEKNECIIATEVSLLVIYIDIYICIYIYICIEGI